MPHAVDAVQRHAPEVQVLPDAHCADVVHVAEHACVTVEQRPGLQMLAVDSQRGWQKPCVPTERQ